MPSRSVAVYFSLISLAVSAIPSLLAEILYSKFHEEISEYKSGYKFSKYLFTLSLFSAEVIALFKLS